jgi:hypothetical protein
MTTTLTPVVSGHWNSLEMTGAAACGTDQGPNPIWCRLGFQPTASFAFLGFGLCGINHFSAGLNVTPQGCLLAKLCWSQY